MSMCPCACAIRYAKAGHPVRPDVVPFYTPREVHTVYNKTPRGLTETVFVTLHTRKE